MRLHYGQAPGPASFADLLDRMPDVEFEKLTRSTVPLLAWWSQPESLQLLADCLALPDPANGEAWFEYAVSPTCQACGGRGKSSFTDLMLELDHMTIAIEAKHYERPYATISEWLGSAPSENKRRVLRHWLSCCLGTAVPPDDCGDLVYQMVHRSASACAFKPERPTRAVVHLLFGSDHPDDYVREVTKVARRFSDVALHYSVVNVPTASGRAFGRTLHEIGARGPDALREALAAGEQLFEFGRPEAIRI